jgi:hypothetical protein
MLLGGKNRILLKMLLQVKISLISFNLLISPSNRILRLKGIKSLLSQSLPHPPQSILVVGGIKGAHMARLG